jgi:hypothetical protein
MPRGTSHTSCTSPTSRSINTIQVNIVCNGRSKVAKYILDVLNGHGTRLHIIGGDSTFKLINWIGLGDNNDTVSLDIGELCANSNGNRTSLCGCKLYCGRGTCIVTICITSRTSHATGTSVTSGTRCTCCSCSSCGASCTSSTSSTCCTSCSCCTRYTRCSRCTRCTRCTSSSCCTSCTCLTSSTCLTRCTSSSSSASWPARPTGSSSASSSQPAIDRLRRTGSRRRCRCRLTCPPRCSTAGSCRWKTRSII